MAGASLMVRREVFEAIGLLDEGYFMYFEEVDFCLKAVSGRLALLVRAGFEGGPPGRAEFGPDQAGGADQAAASLLV